MNFFKWIFLKLNSFYFRLKYNIFSFKNTNFSLSRLSSLVYSIIFVFLNSCKIKFNYLNDKYNIFIFIFVWFFIFLTIYILFNLYTLSFINIIWI